MPCLMIQFPCLIARGFFIRYMISIANNTYYIHIYILYIYISIRIIYNIYMYILYICIYIYMYMYISINKYIYNMMLWFYPQIGEAH